MTCTSVSVISETVLHPVAFKEMLKCIVVDHKSSDNWQHTWKLAAKDFCLATCLMLE